MPLHGIDQHRDQRLHVRQQVSSGSNSDESMRGSGRRREGGNLRLEPTSTADSLWHLQARQAAHARPRSKRWARPGQDDFAACVSAHDSSPIAGGRCRAQRHPRLARSRQSRHDQSVRRDHPANQAGSSNGMHASDDFGGIPAPRRMASRPGPDEMAAIALKIVCRAAGDSPSPARFSGRHRT